MEMRGDILGKTVLQFMGWNSIDIAEGYVVTTNDAQAMAKSCILLAEVKQCWAIDSAGNCHWFERATRETSGVIP